MEDILLINGCKWYSLTYVCIRLKKRIADIANCICIDNIRFFNGEFYINEDSLEEMTTGLFAI